MKNSNRDCPFSDKNSGGKESSFWKILMLQEGSQKTETDGDRGCPSSRDLFAFKSPRQNNIENRF